MKKHYLLALLILQALMADAQPIFDYTAMSDFSVVGYNIYGIENFSAGTPGPNKVWDYHSLVLDASFTAHIFTIPVNSGVGHENFPTANYCEKIVFSNSSPNRYNFYKITNTQRETLGQTNEAGDIILQYTDTPNWPFPLHYGDSYSYTYQLTSDASSSLGNGAYDAYGALTTPFGTFTNVIRTQETNASRSEIRWTQVSPSYVPLMVLITIASSQFTFVNVYDVLNLSVKQNEISSEIMVFPNPATNYLKVQLPDKQIPDNLIVTDITGKILLQLNNKDQIDLEEWSAGIYFIKGSVGNKKFQTKFIKK